MCSFRIASLLGGILLVAGCAGAELPSSISGLLPASTKEQRLAPVPAAGPRPAIAVASFEIEAPKAKDTIGDGLKDMLSTALYQTHCCRVLDTGGEGTVGATYLVSGALTEFEPDVAGATTTSQGSGMLAQMLQELGIQSAELEGAHVGIDIRVVELPSRVVQDATHIRGMAVNIESLKFGDDSLGSGLEVYSNTPMEAAVRDAIEDAADFVAQSVLAAKSDGRIAAQ